MFKAEGASIMFTTSFHESAWGLFSEELEAIP